MDRVPRDEPVFLMKRYNSAPARTRIHIEIAEKMG